MDESRRLCRSEDQRMLAGVCGGLAEFFGLDPTVVRLLWVLGTLFSGGAGVPLYLVAWVIVPRRSKVGEPPREYVREGVGEMGDQARRGAEEARRAYARLRGGGDEQPAGPAAGADPSAPASPPVVPAEPGPAQPPPAVGEDLPGQPPGEGRPGDGGANPLP